MRNVASRWLAYGRVALSILHWLNPENWDKECNQDLVRRNGLKTSRPYAASLPYQIVNRKKPLGLRVRSCFCLSSLRFLGELPVKV